MRVATTRSRPTPVGGLFLLLSALACAACGGPWTARVCAANASGSCRGSTPFGDRYMAKSLNAVKLVNGLTDVDIKDTKCPNGIGALEATVVDRDTLDINVYCLSDQPSPAGGTMTLAPAAPAAPTGTMTLPPTPSAAAPALAH